MRRVAQILSTVLVTAGLVLALEAALTLAWSEPVTNYEAWNAQKEAAKQLAGLEREYRLPGGGRFDPQAVPALADRLARDAEEGEAIGRIKIPAIDVNIVAVEGTETATLELGPGHYPKTAFPGQPGTTAFAGHRTTYLAPFRNLNRLSGDDRVIVEMPYATLTYEFEQQRIVNPSQVGVVRDVGYERIVLTACHPLYSAAQRIVVFARLVEVGPPAGSKPLDGEIAEAGLGPTLAGMAGLLLIAFLMWFWGGRRPERHQ